MPAYVPVTPGLFSDDGRGNVRLLAGRCGGCAAVHFPRATICPYCSMEGCVEQPVGATGTLHLFTSVINRPPGYRGEVPFGFGVVELPEGLRVISRLTESDASRLRFGQTMRLVLAPLHQDDEGRPVMSYAYRPEGP